LFALSGSIMLEPHVALFAKPGTVVLTTKVGWAAAPPGCPGW
jgi:hypothetical protein